MTCIYRAMYWAEALLWWLRYLPEDFWHGYEGYREARGKQEGAE